MKKTLILLSALLAAPMVPQVWADVAATPADQCPAIPDSVGRAGMVAVSTTVGGDHDAILMTGGANFPNALPGAKTPAERGAKVYYDEILLFVDGKVTSIGKAPRPIGYAAYAPCGTSGMVVAGGCNGDGHTSTTRFIGFQFFFNMSAHSGHITTNSELLAPLPCTLAYPAFGVVGKTFYVMGGQEKADSTTCEPRCFKLELDQLDAGWKEVSPMPSPRMLAASGVVDGKIYVAGGCSLHPDAKGNAERTYLNDVWCYDPQTDEWKDMGTPAPETIVGAATPMPAKDGKLYLLCGDPGNFYRASLKGEAPEVHPGQNTAVYSYCPETGKWEKEGDNSIGVATAPAVQHGDTIRIISGETHPGVRTPVISTLQINK